MVTVQPEQALTLAAIITEGTFDAAAQRLHLTPSAVSQRVRALEIAIGRPVLRRVRPVEMTPAGEAVVRFARQLELLSVDLSDQLEPAPTAPRLGSRWWSTATPCTPGPYPGSSRWPSMSNSRSCGRTRTTHWTCVRRGTAHGAVTATAAPVPGCVSRPLGVMRYRPVCTPAFAARWFADGVTSTTLSTAPVVVYDDKDDLQDRYLRRHRRTALQPPRHYVPATHEFGQAIQLGLGWGMLPELQLAQLESGMLRPLASSAHLDVPLYWQQWRLTSTALNYVASAITDAAQALQRHQAGARRHQHQL